jgi:hypothetical protein
LGVAVLLILFGAAFGIPIGWVLCDLLSSGYVVNRDASGKIISVQQD